MGVVFLNGCTGSGSCHGGARSNGGNLWPSSYERLTRKPGPPDSLRHSSTGLSSKVHGLVCQQVENTRQRMIEESCSEERMVELYQTWGLAKYESPEDVQRDQGFLILQPLFSKPSLSAMIFGWKEEWGVPENQSSRGVPGDMMVTWAPEAGRPSRHLYREDRGGHSLDAEDFLDSVPSMFVSGFHDIYDPTICSVSLTSQRLFLRSGLCSVQAARDASSNADD